METKIGEWAPNLQKFPANSLLAGNLRPRPVRSGLCRQPTSPGSNLLSCDTRELARLRAISGVGSQSPLTDLGDSTGFEAAVSKGWFWLTVFVEQGTKQWGVFADRDTQGSALLTPARRAPPPRQRHSASAGFGWWRRDVAPSPIRGDWVTAQVGWMAHERRRDCTKFAGLRVRASMMFQPCFLAVEMKERMRAKSIAPSKRAGRFRPPQPSPMARPSRTYDDRQMAGGGARRP